MNKRYVHKRIAIMVIIGRYILHICSLVQLTGLKAVTERTTERMSCGVTVKLTIKMEHNFVKNDFRLGFILLYC